MEKQKKGSLSVLHLCVCVGMSSISTLLPFILFLTRILLLLCSYSILCHYPFLLIGQLRFSEHISLQVNHLQRNRQAATAVGPAAVHPLRDSLFFSFCSTKKKKCVHTYHVELAAEAGFSSKSKAHPSRKSNCNTSTVHGLSLSLTHIS